VAQLENYKVAQKITKLAQKLQVAHIKRPKSKKKFMNFSWITQKGKNTKIIVIDD